MPKTELHKKKFKKNMLALAIIFGFCALLWSITLIRMADQVTPPDDNATAAQTTPADEAMDAPAP